MRPFVDLVVVVPIGPACKVEFILDTLASVKHYVRCNCKLVISDDSQHPTVYEIIHRTYPDAIILKTRKNHGKGLGLYTTLSMAYRFALDHFDFRALLRLDTDALIIGPNAEDHIFEYFMHNPDVGLAGRYVKGLRALDDFGNVWENGGRAMIVSIAKIFTRFYLRHPVTYWKIRDLIFKALDNGYEMGDLIFGGTYAFSRTGLEKLSEHGLLPLPNAFGTELEEDHTFSVLICAVGLRLGDLASNSHPFACTWKGLPARPEALLDANKKIIHSTRYWQELNEAEVRKYFKEIRES
ncbi:glycosyltransferase family 2 protein [Chryseolinea sp. H1M3-3]|uniref:glycosyltransferase family 2 protein n=1 Tax=Chryseolinea sp. H1M3-3 TaxID=3034144 RepID=UPI0023EC8B51|nr:glycosyltransferase family 2 protein [Chryseolinea sp. H1M3-3]